MTEGEDDYQVLLTAIHNWKSEIFYVRGVLDFSAVNNVHFFWCMLIECGLVTHTQQSSPYCKAPHQF